MTTRLAAVRRGDRGAFLAILLEHGAALESLASSFASEARVEGVVLRIWKDAALVDATANERAFVITTAARDLARTVIPARQRATPETDAASMVWHLARGITGLGDDVDLEIVTDTVRDDAALAALADRWREAITRAFEHPAGALSDPGLWSKIEPKLR